MTTALHQTAGKAHQRQAVLRQTVSSSLFSQLQLERQNKTLRAATICRIGYAADASGTDASLLVFRWMKMIRLVPVIDGHFVQAGRQHTRWKAVRWGCHWHVPCGQAMQFPRKRF